MATLYSHRQNGNDRMEISRQKHLWVGRLTQEKLCDSKYHTKKKPFNQMKSETNIGIKSYRNAEVNGMEHNLCKNVEVLGNKGPSRSYMIQCEMCIW